MKNFTGEQSGIRIIAQRILQGQYSQIGALPAIQEGRSPQPQARGKQFPYNHEANPLHPDFSPTTSNDKGVTHG